MKNQKEKVISLQIKRDEKKARTKMMSEAQTAAECETRVAPKWDFFLTHKTPGGMSVYTVAAE